MNKFRFLSVVLAMVCLAGFFGINSGFVNSVSADTKWEIHYWNFDDSLSDAAASDKYDLDGTPVFADGKNGKALNTAEMTAAPQTGILTADTLNGYTMGAWIYLNEGATGFNIIMAKGNTNAADSDRFQIHISNANDTDGGGFLTVYSPAASSGAFPGDGEEEYSAARFVAFNTWVHVAVTFNGDLAKVFVNGSKIYELQIQGQLQDSISSHQKITVGALTDKKQFLFNGLIDDAFYANYAMTEADVAAAADGTASLQGWADGSKSFTPDSMKERVTPEPTEVPTDSKTSGLIYFWPFENDYNDMSHKEFDFDYEEMYPDFTEGKVGQAVLLEDVTICTDSFSEDLDLTEFTFSYWVRFDGIPNALPYYVVTAFGDKTQRYHYETYLVSTDCTEGSFASYNTAGNPIEGLATFAVGEYNHVVITNSKTKGLDVYVNGELAAHSNNAVFTEGLCNGFDRFTLGSLQDYSLPCFGAYDEVILADYVFPAELVAKLYSDPQGAHDDVLALVKANAPEGYARATAKPTAAPTETPTKAPETAVPEQTPTSAPTKAPVKDKDNAGKDSNNSAAVIIIIAAAVVVVGIIVAITIILKKKK